MRAAAALLLLLSLSAVAHAVPPPPRPEIEIRCSGPLDEARIRACFAKVSPQAKLTATAPSVISAVMPDTSTYLLVGAGGSWRIGMHQWDAGYEFLGAKPLSRTATRVDLMHHMVIGTAQVLIERITVVCKAGGYCQSFTTACTMLDHGRTTGMFRLVVTDGDEGVTATGDKSYSGEMCSGR